MTILYILYYILAYIQHNGDVSLDSHPKRYAPCIGHISLVG